MKRSTRYKQLAVVLSCALLGVGVFAATRGDRVDAGSPSFWPLVTQGSEGADFLLTYSSFDEIFPGEPIQETVSGTRRPAELVFRGTPSGVRPSVAYGQVGDEGAAPTVPFDDPEAAFRWVVVDVVVEEVVAGDTGLEGQTIPLELPEARESFSQLEGSVDDAGAGLFFVSPVESVLADGRAPGEAATVHAGTFRVVGLAAFADADGKIDPLFLDVQTANELAIGSDRLLDALAELSQDPVDRTEPFGGPLEAES